MLANVSILNSKQGYRVIVREDGKQISLKQTKRYKEAVAVAEAYQPENTYGEYWYRNKKKNYEVKGFDYSDPEVGIGVPRMTREEAGKYYNEKLNPIWLERYMPGNIPMQKRILLLEVLKGNGVAVRKLLEVVA